MGMNIRGHQMIVLRHHILDVIMTEWVTFQKESSEFEWTEWKMWYLKICRLPIFTNKVILEVMYAVITGIMMLISSNSLVEEIRYKILHICTGILAIAHMESLVISQITRLMETLKLAVWSAIRDWSEALECTVSHKSFSPRIRLCRCTISVPVTNCMERIPRNMTIRIIQQQQRHSMSCGRTLIMRHWKQDLS